MLTRLAAAALSAVALVALAGCSDDSTPTPAPTAGETAGSPTEGVTASGGETSFDGEVATESIKVGPQDVTVPKGIKLPESSLVTDSQELLVMIIDEDPGAVIDTVTQSAEESGYELYAEPDDTTTVWVGNGNAVRLFAVSGAQMLVWGPESMKDALATPGA